MRSAGSGALRRRRKPSLATRLRIAWVFIVLAVSAAAYGGYVLVTLPQLRVHGVDVQIAGPAVTKQAVLAAAQIDRHGNIWLLNTAAIAQRIEAVPYVDRAAVGRSLPAQLTIAVSEREPAACVRSGARVVTVDRLARVLQNGCARASDVRILLQRAALPAPGAFATPPGLAELLADGRALADARLAIRSIGEDAYGGLIAVDTAGVELLFGRDADLAKKARLVNPVLAATAPGHAVRAVDLRAPATPTVEFR